MSANAPFAQAEQNIKFERKLNHIFKKGGFDAT